MFKLKIKGNDLELDDTKVARLFDLSEESMFQLQTVIQVFNKSFEMRLREVDAEYQRTYITGWHDGYQEGVKNDANS